MLRFFASIQVLFRELRTYQFLVWQLVRTSMLGNYKKSFIGMAWMFIIPILAVLVWILLQRAGIVQAGDTGQVPYPVYVLLSTSVWGFFLEIYKSVSQVMVQNGRLLVMKDFPAEILVLAKVVEQMIHFLVPLAINIIVLVAFGIQFHASALMFLPSLLPLLALGLGMGMVIAIFRVVAVDFATIVDEGMKLVMYVTPVVYTAGATPSWLSPVIAWNPLTYLIGFSRDLLTTGQFYEPDKWAVTVVVALAIFLLAAAFFHVTAKRVLERLTIV